MTPRKPFSPVEWGREYYGYYVEMLAEQVEIHQHRGPSYPSFLAIPEILLYFLFLEVHRVPLAPVIQGSQAVQGFLSSQQVLGNLSLLFDPFAQENLNG